MDDDIDALLQDLSTVKTSVPESPDSSANKTSSTRVNLSELEDLMNDLSMPSKSSYAADSSTSKISSTDAGGVDDLDSLMESLSAAAAPVKVPSPPPAARMSPAQVAPSSDAESLDDLLGAAQTVSVPVKVPSPPPVSVVSPPTSASRAPSSDAESLDDLLGQLSSMATNAASATPASPASPARISSPPVPTSPPATASATKADDLDSLLSNLTSQMNEIDTSGPATRGLCATCGKPVVGEIIQAMGKHFHPEHWVCVNCKKPLGTSPFTEHQGQPHCETCFKSMYCPRCAHCDQPIQDRCITALGKKWHLEHFICAHCLQPFEGGRFYERDGRPYCENDFFTIFASKCASCDQPIKGDCINALGSKWHPEHFVCQYCHKAFAGGAFFEYEGKPYCEVHYHQMTGSLCSGCGKAVTGRCVTALGKKWHPEHFVCAFCMNPLAGGSFREEKGKAYCNGCHQKLFG